MTINKEISKHNLATIDSFWKEQSPQEASLPTVSSTTSHEDSPNQEYLTLSILPHRTSFHRMGWSQIAWIFMPMKSGAFAWLPPCKATGHGELGSFTTTMATTRRWKQHGDLSSEVRRRSRMPFHKPSAPCSLRTPYGSDDLYSQLLLKELKVIIYN